MILQFEFLDHTVAPRSRTCDEGGKIPKRNEPNSVWIWIRDVLEGIINWFD